jgi:hypothetical protein
VFNKIFAELARRAGKPDQLMIDATHLKAHRTAASLLKKGLWFRRGLFVMLSPVHGSLRRVQAEFPLIQVVQISRTSSLLSTHVTNRATLCEPFLWHNAKESSLSVSHWKR